MLYQNDDIARRTRKFALMEKNGNKITQLYMKSEDRRKKNSTRSITDIECTGTCVHVVTHCQRRNNTEKRHFEQSACSVFPSFHFFQYVKEKTVISI